MIPPNNSDYGAKIHSEMTQAGAAVSNKLNNLIKALKSDRQNAEMNIQDAPIQEKKPSLLSQGRKAISDTWTEGKQDISSRIQNLGIGRMLHEQASKILERLKENHRTTSKTVVDTPTFPQPVQSLLDLAKKTEPAATPQELKEAGKAIKESFTRIDPEPLKAISKNLTADQLSHVIMGALDHEIEGHVSASNVLRENTTGNQLLGEFALVHLSKEFNRSQDLQSLLNSIPQERLDEGDSLNESAVPETRQFMDAYLTTTQSLLGSSSNEMKLFKGIIKNTAASIDNKFGAEIGAGGTAGVNLLFLRVLNPIIVSPEAKGITLNENRTPDQMKNATLFTKVAQSMANNVISKESKMVVFNDLLAEKESQMNEVKNLLIS